MNGDFTWLESHEINYIQKNNSIISFKKKKVVDLSFTGFRMILGLRPANERRCYKVTLSLIGWAQT